MKVNVKSVTSSARKRDVPVVPDARVKYRSPEPSQSSYTVRPKSPKR
jgi:hypothetical protein